MTDADAPGAGLVTESDIADLLERVAQDLDPAVGLIVAKAEQMSRRMRLRRRAWIAAGCGLAIAAAAGVGLAGISLARPPLTPAVAAGSHGAAGSQGTAGRGTASAAGWHPPGRAGGKSRGPLTAVSPAALMTRQQMLVTLRRLLPAGGILSDPQTSTGPGSLEIDYNDGKGAVDLRISVMPTAAYSEQVVDCPRPLWTDEGPRPAFALPVSCTRRMLADGSIERDAVMYADGSGFYGYDIYDRRPAGITVFIQVGNGTDHTVPQVDRARPPGSMAEWRAVAENAAWRL